MCQPTPCPNCGKTTWKGCGNHVDDVMRHVPAARRCTCQRPTSSADSCAACSAAEPPLRIISSHARDTLLTMTARRLDPEARRAQIIECAAKLFEERPYSDVSTTEIAAAARVGRPLVNHYFGNKRELYLEVVRRFVFVPAIVVEPIPKFSPPFSNGSRR